MTSWCLHAELVTSAVQTDWYYLDAGDYTAQIVKKKTLKMAFRDSIYRRIIPFDVNGSTIFHDAGHYIYKIREKLLFHMYFVGQPLLYNITRHIGAITAQRWEQ